MKAKMHVAVMVVFAVALVYEASLAIHNMQEKTAAADQYHAQLTDQSFTTKMGTLVRIKTQVGEDGNEYHVFWGPWDSWSNDCVMNCYGGVSIDEAIAVFRAPERSDTVEPVVAVQGDATMMEAERQIAIFNQKI